MLHFHPATRSMLIRLACCALLLTGARADATSVTLHANAFPRSGFSRADVAAAIAAGAAQPTQVSGMIDGRGYFTVTTPYAGWGGHGGRNGKKSSSGSTTWTLRVAQETPAELLGEVFLVILGRDRSDPMNYKREKIGLEIDTSLPWLLLENETRPGMFHIAYALGAVEPGGTYQIPIEYRVAGKLKKKRGKYWLPQFSVAFLARPAAVLPEPAPLALLAAAAAMGWLVGRRAS